MATRLIGTDDADPRLPALVVAATQGSTSADLAPGDILDTLDSTATWTSPFSAGVTVGNGTTTAVYTQVGQIVWAGLSFTLGTTSAITGSITLAPPVTANALGYRAVCSFTDTSASIVYDGIVQSGLLRAVNASATYATLTATSATVPFTWASTDAITVTLIYLAA